MRCSTVGTIPNPDNLDLVTQMMRVTLMELWGKEGMLHYASQLANSLACLPEIQVTAILPRGSDTSLFAPSVDLHFVDVVGGASLKELTQVPLCLLKLPHFFKVIRQSRPDILHLNNCHVWYIMTLPWLRRHYPIVSTLHDVKPHPGQDNSLRKRKEIDTLVGSSQRVFVHGEGLRKQLRSKYPIHSRDSVTVIPHGDYSFFGRYPSDETEKAHTVLWFGRVREYKGLEYLLRAAVLVSEACPKVKFLIAGQGDLRPYGPLLGESINLEIHNRYIPEEEVADFFRQASIVVLPYIEASQSGVIPIAYAFQKPVVATHVGCLPDVIDDGQTGLLVQPRDADALAQAMLRLLRDDGLREKLGRNAYEKMQNELGWEKIAASTVNTYRAAIQEFPSKAHTG